MPRRVRILPESQLPHSHAGPTLPDEDPPRPEDLVSLLVVGQAHGGKTSLVESLVHHTSLPTRMEDAASVQSYPSSRATGSRNSQRQVVVEQKSWSVKYHKKDMLLAATSTRPPSNTVDENCSSLRSLRVQLWDTSGLTAATYNNNINHERDADWKVFWNKASVVCIVVSLGDRLDDVLRNIRAWHAWCEHQQVIPTNSDEKEYVLFLHQADLLESNAASTTKGQQQHPTDWMQRGSKITDLCRSLPLITSWHFTSSRLEDPYLGNSIDTAFRQLLGTKGKPYILKPSSNRSANWSDTPTAITADTTSDHTTTDPTTNGTPSRNSGTRGRDHNNRRSNNRGHQETRRGRSSVVPVSPLS